MSRISHAKNATRWHLKVHTMCCPWCAHLRCARCKEKKIRFPELWLGCCRCRRGAVARIWVQSAGEESGRMRKAI